MNDGGKHILNYYYSPPQAKPRVPALAAAAFGLIAFFIFSMLVLSLLGVLIQLM